MDAAGGFVLDCTKEGRVLWLKVLGQYIFYSAVALGVLQRHPSIVSFATVFGFVRVV